MQQHEWEIDREVFLHSFEIQRYVVRSKTCGKHCYMESQWYKIYIMQILFYILWLLVTTVIYYEANYEKLKLICIDDFWEVISISLKRRIKLVLRNSKFGWLSQIMLIEKNNWTSSSIHYSRKFTEGNLMVLILNCTKLFTY